jgi:hypothetical protein
MRQVMAGAWKTADEDKVVVFVANISKSDAHAEITLYPEEYGVDAPQTVSVTLAPTSVRVIEYPTKK